MQSFPKAEAASSNLAEGATGDVVQREDARLAVSQQGFNSPRLHHRGHRPTGRRDVRNVEIGVRFSVAPPVRFASHQPEFFLLPLPLLASCAIAGASNVGETDRKPAASLAQQKQPRNRLAAQACLLSERFRLEDIHPKFSTMACLTVHCRLSITGLFILGKDEIGVRLPEAAPICERSRRREFLGMFADRPTYCGLGLDGWALGFQPKETGSIPVARSTQPIGR